MPDNNYYLLCIVVSGCSNGDLKLIGERDNASGQIFFCVAGQWAAICSDALDENDARVVCRQLGLPTEGHGVYFNLYYNVS